MQTIEVGPSDFINGVLFDDNLEGAGISPLYKGHNYFKGKGSVMYPQPTPTTVTLSGGTLSSAIVAGCLDPTYLGSDGFLVDGNGKFWMLNSTTMTYKNQDDTVGAQYNFGNVDIKSFGGYVFCTNNYDIVQLTTALGGIDKTWWTVTMGKSGLISSFRHPMEIVEDSLYVADQYKIHMITYTPSLSAQYAWMELPDSFNITAMCKHSNGVYLLAFASETANYSHTKKARSKIFVIDTNSGEFIQEIDVDDQTEGAINVGGIVYVTYGDNFGYFTGNGYKLLRKLSAPGGSVVTLYSQKLASLGNTILLPESETTTASILAYGDINGGGNIFFYPYSRDDSSLREIKNILTIKPNAFLFCQHSGTAYEVKIMDLTATTSAGATMATHKRPLTDRYFVRRIDLFTDNLVSGSGITLYIKNTERVNVEVGSYLYSVDGAGEFKRFDCNIRINELQLKTVWSSGNAVGFKKAIIYVEPE
jgi:hypothetical protein